jgi:uncharacterized protein with PIN domain
MVEEKDKSKGSETPEPDKQSYCPVCHDPFSDLPPELRPHPENNMGDLRRITCPGCGLVYWTNRKTNLCTECEKKGVRLPEV